MLTRHVALVADPSEIPTSDLTKVAAALQRQATKDFGPIWGVEATVDAFTDLGDVPLQYWPIHVRRNFSDPTAEGYHIDRNHQPYALILLDASWTLSASHECLEMLADPHGNCLVAGTSIDPKHPDNRVRYLLEVCDPCEDSRFAYTIDGIVVSDFITPHYHDSAPNAHERYSFTGSIKEPREVLKNGYLSWEDPSLGAWFQATYFGPQLRIKNIGEIGHEAYALREAVNRLTETKPADAFHKKARNVVAAAKRRSASAKASKARAVDIVI